ncbi:ABC transporter permease [Aquihabitans sp. McL0605]|uniref:ABC transporter permease n=1 Tax=Aquihabitans sp. McL0605 TaxID=3415671 RepID=UPI003CEFD539
MSISIDPPPEHHEPLVPDRVKVSPALEVSKRPNPFQRVAHLWQYRELIGNLTRKELKVKYKNSILGFAWSLLNPLMYLVVFSLVFNIISDVHVPYYGIFFLSGLLAWNFFSAGLGSGTSSIVQNAQLVTKVWFPREALVLASVFTALVHFFLQSIVLLAALLVFRRMPDPTYIPVFLLALVVIMLLGTALAVGLSAVNVYLRDTQHLLEVVLLAWFWLSAIAYPYGSIVTHLNNTRYAGKEWILNLNPMITVVIAFQRTLYNPDYSNKEEAAVLPNHPMSWYLTYLSIDAVVAIVLLFGALALFSRLEDNFAEAI